VRFGPTSLSRREILRATSRRCARRSAKARGDHRFIVTIPGRGYRFVAEVREVGGGEPEAANPAAAPMVAVKARGAGALAAGARPRPAMWGKALVGAGVALLCVAAVRFGSGRRAEQAAVIPQSLAVLPFRPLNRSQEDEFLGVGLADAVITRLSETGKIVVRPTSAVSSTRRPPRTRSRPAASSRRTRCWRRASGAPARRFA
jgi:hypothetical protein